MYLIIVAGETTIKIKKCFSATISFSFKWKKGDNHISQPNFQNRSYDDD